jgi:hypothetical protein
VDAVAFGNQSELEVKVRQKALLKATNCGSCGSRMKLRVSGISMQKFQKVHKHWEYTHYICIPPYAKKHTNQQGSVLYDLAFHYILLKNQSSVPSRGDLLFDLIFTCKITELCETVNAVLNTHTHTHTHTHTQLYRHSTVQCVLDCYI